MPELLSLDLAIFLSGTIAAAFVTVFQALLSAWSPRRFRLFLFGLPALAIGTWLGWMLYGKLDEGAFRRVVLILLLVFGAALTASAWR